MDYRQIRGVYILQINITEIEDELELIIDVVKVLNDFDNTCANFLVEKYSDMIIVLAKNEMITMKVRDSNCFNSNKMFITKLKMNHWLFVE